MQESRHEHWVLMCAQIKIMFSVCNRQYHNGNNSMGLGVGKKKKKHMPGTSPEPFCSYVKHLFGSSTSTVGMFVL